MTTAVILVGPSHHLQAGGQSQTAHLRNLWNEGPGLLGASPSSTDAEPGEEAGEIHGVLWKLSVEMVKGYHGIKFKYSQKRG